MQNESGLSPAWNSTGERIPPFALVKPTGVFDSQGRMAVKKPDADSESGLWVNSEISMEPGTGGGVYQSLKTTVSYDMKGGIPGTGEELGSKAGSWYATRGQGGFKCIAAKDGIMNAMRVPDGCCNTECGDYYSILPYASSTEQPIPGDPGILVNDFNIALGATTGPITPASSLTVKPLITRIPAGSGTVDIYGQISGYLTGVSPPNGPGAVHTDPTLFFIINAILTAVEPDGTMTTYTSADVDVPYLTIIAADDENSGVIKGQFDWHNNAYGDVGNGASFWGTSPVLIRRVKVGSDNDLYLTFGLWGMGQWPGTTSAGVAFGIKGMTNGLSYIRWRRVCKDCCPEPFLWAP